tara:strand:- start:30033 stop:32393 length:2361 start_codon:yes stop_codon:yes gene_type:complete
MSLSNVCKRNTTLSYLIICLFSVAFLSACGLSGDRNGTGGQASTIGSGGSGGGDDNDPFSIKEKIGVRVERINGEINDVSTTQISIVTLNQDFKEIGSNSTPAYQVEPRLSGGFELQFSSSYIERLNQVIKVTFDNTTTPPEFLYAPLYKVASETESITVNSKSHYVVKKMFDAISDSIELAQLLPCTSSSTVCPNQSMAKANMLEQINIATNDYNIDINESFTVAQAMNLLDAQLDLRQQVETAVNEISRIVSPFSKATRRSFTFGTDGDVITNLTIPLSYHSVLFGLSFSDIRPNDNVNSVKISSLSSTIVEPADTESNPVYPGFNQTISLLDMRRDVLSSDIPFERTNLDIAQNNSFNLNDTEALNSFTSELSDSFLSTQGFLLNERIIQQTIPNNIGWEFSPLFTRSYQTNEYDYPSRTVALKPAKPDYGSAPTWLVSSNYSQAASFELSGSDEALTRGEQLEDSHIFSWEVHGLETNKDENFSISSMNDKRYGAISYSLKLDDQDNTNIIQVIAETAEWNINSGTSSGTILLSQPSSHYQTLSLSRNDDNLATGKTVVNNLLSNELSIARVETEGNGGGQQGLITIEGPSSGHSTSNGNYMALVFNTKEKDDPLDRGQGIILASELVNFNYLFSGESYQLQGNSFEINQQANILHNLNGSSIIIADRVSGDFSNDCIASLSVKRTSVTHIIGSQANTLSAPIESTLSDVSSQSCTVNGSEIQLDFGLVFGEPLTLRGFITQKNDNSTSEPGNLINFVWEQDTQLGLVFANKEQDLSPTFSD